MKLFSILKNCSTNYYIKNKFDNNVLGISSDSREIKNNFIFSVIKGEKFNGQDFIKKLMHLKQVTLILSDDLSASEKVSTDYLEKFVIIYSNKVRELTSEIASLIYKNKINELVSVTGTNGKTSIADYTRQIWEKNNIRCASIGTLGTIFNKKQHFSQKLTTPQSIDLLKVLNKISKKKCEKVIIEASSIGIDQGRLSNLKFDKIVFTNLSRDHLDYHKNMRDYLNAKLRLFKNHNKEKTLAIINNDDLYSNYFAKICKKKKLKILSYGLKGNFIRFLSLRKKENFFEVKLKIKDETFKYDINCNSRFEVYNIICSLIICFGEKLKYSDFRVINNIKQPKGRLEKVYDKEFKIFVDYAHTPEALKNVLISLNEIKKKKIICLIGAGGNRDKGKRSMLTKKALMYSDIIILADDNPRDEDPEKIRKDMLKGINKKNKEKIFNIGDREKAIKYAVNKMEENDILLVAGKGHEKYQIINGFERYFSDHETINNLVGS